jgi:hypothetical protein
MYDIQSQNIINYWTVLEDLSDNISMILYSKIQPNYITISNRNEMKYLDVTIDNGTTRFTHIHSFVNEMLVNYGDNIFHNYLIKFNHDVNKKRKIDNIEDIKKKPKYE